MASCLVLGANGFIGSHLVDKLIDAGHSVRAFGHFSSEPVFNKHENIELFAGDFLNRGDIRNAVKGVDFVFHFISTTTPATAENDPLVDIDSNIRMSVELFEECSKANVKRVIFASTGGTIYGEQATQDARLETDLPLPISPYAIGKLSIEHYLRFYRIKHGLDSVSLRISNPYGERQPFHRRQGVIPIFLENVCRGRSIDVFGDGSMVRDYIYVKDLADMVVGMFDKPLKHEVYNLGSGSPTSLNDLIEAISMVTDVLPEITYHDTPATYVKRVVLDTSRYLDEFEVRPNTTLSQGINQTYSYIQREINNEG